MLFTKIVQKSNHEKIIFFTVGKKCHSGQEGKQSELSQPCFTHHESTKQAQRVALSLLAVDGVA